MTYQYGTTHGDGSASDLAKVYVLKASNPNENSMDQAYNGVSKALKQAVNYSNGPSIGGARIEAYKTDHTVDCSNRYGSDSPQNQFLDDEGYDGETGSFLWVTQCDGSNAAGGGSWNNRRLAYVDVHFENDAYIRSVSAQEALHNYINKNCNDVEQYLGGANGEHDLGKVIQDGTLGYITAMAGGYTNSYDSGTCATTNNADVYSARATDCTCEALRYSYEHANGQH